MFAVQACRVICSSRQEQKRRSTNFTSGNNNGDLPMAKLEHHDTAFFVDGGLAKCVQRAYSVVDASQQALANTAARFLHSLNFANGCCQPSLAHLLSEIIICTTKSQC
ncbi:hypothetical protein CY35_17G092300 [Sphagnum magellanicum]|nr:hypothetical protein CY35_17G092300 [Sphagnum magellanicum]KAH9536157.1 hypothetical protein CY35_17G092300 [Sphagnum magellanicum]